MNLSFRKNILIFTACLVGAILNGYLFNYLNDKYFQFHSNQNGLSSFSKCETFIIIVFIAPIVETIFFNYLPNFYLRKLKINNSALLVIIPSLLFAFFHFYNPIFALMAFIAALIVNWYFNVNRNIFVAVASVCLLHVLYNLYGYLFVN